LRVYNLYVYGKVQRVEFRRYILDLAQELSLAGQIKNLSDGSVEIFIQGDEKILLKFIELIKQPPIGIVKDIKIKEAIVKPKMKKFTIVYGKLADELQEDLELCKKYSYNIGKSLEIIGKNLEILLKELMKTLS
jgi:acylphosphatase